MTKRICHLVTFGLGGHGEELTPKCHVSGYCKPENWSASREASHDVIYPDGTPVIDKRAILEKSPYLAFESPMVDPTLVDTEVSRCPSPDPLFAAAVQHNELGTLLNCHAAHKAKTKEPGPLDSVSVAAFVDWWRKNGARIGEIHNGSIFWEEK